MSPVAKRVLFVENGIGYGGAIICLRHLIRHLDPSRYRALVITGRTGPHYREIAAEADWHHISDRCVDVVTLRGRIESWVLASRLPKLRAFLLQCVARLDDLANFLPFFLRLLAFGWRHDVELIHANNEPLCNRAALVAGKLLRIPVVCHVRGDQNGSAATRWLYRLPDHFIPVSRWISAGIGRLGIPDARRTVVYDGIALDRLDLNADGAAFRSRWSIPADAFTVGLIGLLIPWKGQNVFLDAAFILRARIPGLCMLVIGGTPEDCAGYEAQLRARAAREDLGGTVIFTGHVTAMEPVYKTTGVSKCGMPS